MEALPFMVWEVGAVPLRRCFWCGHTPVLGHAMQVSGSSVVPVLVAAVALGVMPSNAVPKALSQLPHPSAAPSQRETAVVQGSC